MTTITLKKLPSGISGLDLLAGGGVPENRTTLVSGTAGSGKTLLAAQFLTEGIRSYDEAGVFVTFEETPEDIRRNVQSLDWEVERYEHDGTWRFIDASFDPGRDAAVVGEYDFGALLARIEHAVRSVGATRVVLDSIGAVFARFHDPGSVRTELLRIAAGLRAMGVTSLMTAERRTDFGDVARFGVEEFVADNVIVLRNALEEENRRRTVEILKFRGADHRSGQFPFTIQPGEGLVVIALAGLELTQPSTNTRVTSGNDGLDTMCGGGYFRDSVVLVSGATGTGKTLMATEFLAGGVAQEERSIIFALEESRDQLFRNAAGWGYDFAALEAKGLLRVVCAYPETMSLEDHLVLMKNQIDEFRPHRIAVDSLSALERVANLRSFREFIIGLTSHIKHRQMAGFLTSTSGSLLGGPTITEGHISTLTDAIILLRYVEMFGEIRRGLAVLKMRGSPHDTRIHEYTIDGDGLHLRAPYRNVVGILAGTPSHVPSHELDEVASMFGGDSISNTHVGMTDPDPFGG